MAFDAASLPQASRDELAAALQGRAGGAEIAADLHLLAPSGTP
jgi:hypothetical protein